MGGSWQPRRFNEGVDFSTEKNPVGIGWDWLAGQVKVGESQQQRSGCGLGRVSTLALCSNIYIYIHLVLCDLAPVDSSVD